MLEILDRHLPRVIYTPGSATTLVATTYLDTPEGFFYDLARQDRGMRSMKVRLREYFALTDDAERRILAPQAHCYLERKERAGQTRLKQRVRLDKHLAAAVVERRAELPGAGPEARVLQQELSRRSLQPALVSIYERRVWGGDDDTDLRVTFDERIRFHIAPAGLYDEVEAMSPEILGPPIGVGPKRLIEVKHARKTPLPSWLEQLLSPLDDAGRYSKFVDGMQQSQRTPRFVPSLTLPVISGKG